MSWDKDKVFSTKVEGVINNAFNNKYPHIGENVSKAFTLYKYFVNHLDDSPETLMSELTENGSVIFTKQQIQEIQTIIRSQENTSVFQRLLNKSHKSQTPQKGGATTATATPVTKLGEDPSRSKFFDKLIRKIMTPLSSRIPSNFDGLLWYTFLLYNLERMDTIGPFIGMSLDTITLSLPILAELTETVVGKVLSVLPIPYVGLGGELIGHVLGLVFVLFAVFLNFSRKQFGSAFKVSLEAIPIFGDTLMDAAQAIEIGVERYLHNRDRLLQPIAPVSPHLHKFASYWAPDMEVHDEAAPELSLNLVKSDVADYVKDQIGNVTNKVNPDALMNKASKVVTNKVNPSALMNKASKSVTLPRVGMKRKTRKYKSNRR